MSKKTVRRLGAVFCAIGVLCWTSVLLLINSFAADGISNLTLECRTLWGDVLPDEQWNIYKVAELQTDGTYGLYGDFAQYPVSLEDTSASGLTDAAKTFENYAVLDSIVPYATGLSDSNGEVFFGDIPDGLYLVLGNSVVKDNETFTATPFLVNVTYDGSGETMNLIAYPKYTVVDVLGSDKYSVVKKWGNKVSEPEDPDAFVTVEIYCEGSLYDTVDLNAANDWRYSWESNGHYDWRVKEINVPSKYYVKYGSDGAELTVVNTLIDVLGGEDTRTTTTTTTTTTSTETTTVTTTSQTTNTSSTTTTVVTTVTTGGKLPQTGQLWWPVPILCIAGMVFVSAGLIVRSKDSE